MIDVINAIVQKYESLLSVLLVQVAIVAMVASLLLLFRRFRSLVITQHPTPRLSQNFGLVLGIFAGLLSWARIRLGYTGADMTVILPLVSGYMMGVRSGAWTGFVGGIYAARCGEWLTMPMGMGAGIAAGLTLRIASDPNALWDFTPIPFGNVLRIWERWRDEHVLDQRIAIVGVSAGMEIVRTELARALNGLDGRRYLAGFAPDEPLAYYFVVLACLTSIGVAVKIWNAPRVEAQLRRREALLAESRLATLRWQIQPHFLFNTLNTIGALIRTNPDGAREMLKKLSAILRRLLYHREHVNTLRGELAFVEDYLDIEMMRFGPERLRFKKHVDEAVLDAELPTMVLQPLVENSIKHGLSTRASGGTITIRARAADGRLTVSVEDNGRGMDPRDVDDSMRKGIGLSNMNERLKSLYGDRYAFHLTSSPGEGTRAEFALPLVRRSDGQQSAASGAGDE